MAYSSGLPPRSSSRQIPSETISSASAHGSSAPPTPSSSASSRRAPASKPSRQTTGESKSRAGSRLPEAETDRCPARQSR